MVLSYLWIKELLGLIFYFGFELKDYQGTYN